MLIKRLVKTHFMHIFQKDKRIFFDKLLKKLERCFIFLKGLRCNKVYYSCVWWEEGITFCPNKLTVCCDSYFYGVKKPIDIVPYYGGAIPIGKILKARQDNRRHGKKKPSSHCFGCHHLQKRAWPSPKQLLRRININHYYQCNLQCSYCYSSGLKGYIPKENPYDIYDVIKDLLEKRLLAKNAIFSWGGGEPTLLDCFDKIMQLSFKHEIINLVCSNGVVFSEPLAVLLANNKASLTCSVDAGLAETFTRIKGKAVFDVVWRNLVQYASYSVNSRNNVFVKYIFLDLNNNDVDIECFVQTVHKYNLLKIVCDVDAQDVFLEEKKARGILKMKRMAELKNIVVSFGINAQRLGIVQYVSKHTL